MAIRLLVGLGNPGARYVPTRHNVGYRIIDALRENPPALVRLFKPESVFMNLSGGPVAELARKNGIEPGDVLVICDDFTLPLGQLRIRSKGSSGGHNGLNSIIQTLGTADIPRLRVGIGPVPEGEDPADFVLKPFAKAESDALEAVIQRAADAARVVVAEGLETGMNRFNQKMGGSVLKVSDVMRPVKVSLPQNAGLSQVVELFLRHQTDFLPIVDAAQHVVGVISPSDLLDFLFPRFYELLRDYNALEDKGQLSSLFGAAFSGLDIADNKLILAADVMRPSLIWIGTEDTLLSAASRLFGQQVKQLPVVDRDRRLMGLISETDVVLSFLKGNTAATARK